MSSILTWVAAIIIASIIASAVSYLIIVNAIPKLPKLPLEKSYHNEEKYKIVRDENGDAEGLIISRTARLE